MELLLLVLGIWYKVVGPVGLWISRVKPMLDGSGRSIPLAGRSRQYKGYFREEEHLYSILARFHRGNCILPSQSSVA